MPRRCAPGFDKDDFVDRNSSPLIPWQAVAGVLWASAKSPKEDGVAVGQFPEADDGAGRADRAAVHATQAVCNDLACPDDVVGHDR